jgi:hypothetical protein
MKKFEISEELALKILQYLDIKPYGEVARLIAEIQQIKPIDNEKEGNVGQTNQPQ